MSEQTRSPLPFAPLSRRQMLMQAGTGFGYLALAGMLGQQAMAAATATPAGPTGLVAPTPGVHSPLAARPPHFAARAKRVIFLFMQGGPSHLDSFDYKPALARDGGKTGEGKGKLLASPFKFNRYGQSGLYMSELFSNVGKHADEICLLNGMTCDNPAHPQATIQLHTGSVQFVRPSVGAWVLYGLGTQNENLPGFLTINPPSGLGGAQNYGSAFLPATYQGTRIDGNDRNIADIHNKFLTSAQQRRQLDLIQQMNRDMMRKTGPNEQLDGVIESFELGFRMQGAAQQYINQFIQEAGGDNAKTRSDAWTSFVQALVASAEFRYVK